MSKCGPGELPVLPGLVRPADPQPLAGSDQQHRVHAFCSLHAARHCDPLITACCADTYIDPVTSRNLTGLAGARRDPLGAVRRGQSPRASSTRSTPPSIVWLRLVTSAVVLVLVARPALGRRTARDWLVVAGFGASLGVMNWAIYQSFARIPLGIAVTVEFVGPLTLAVLGSRRPRDLLWVALAAVGVGLLGLERGAPHPRRRRCSRCSPAPRGRRTSC